ncbi:MAG: hypothetical protein GY835_03855, partial [bacterium]|nr:hypothetical protein [bacterium]
TYNNCHGCTLQNYEVYAFNTLALDLHGVEATMIPTGEDALGTFIPVLIDEHGYLRCDASIKYAITPGEYIAAGAQVVILKNGSPIAYIPGETSGQGNVTLARGFQIDPAAAYEAHVVLNQGSQSEIRSETVPFRFDGVTTDIAPVTLRRTYFLSQFDASAPGAIGAGYTDDYHPYSITLQSPKTIRVDLLNADLEEIATIVQPTPLPAGRHLFLVDYETVLNAGRGSGIDPVESPRFFIRAAEPTDPDEETCPIEFFYPGTIEERSLGKMLGQIIVHDVLIQDGSLNLTREDVTLKGRGPGLAFTRSYNSQPSARGFTPLGRGWRHGLDLKLEPISSAEYGAHPIPAWVANRLGVFFTEGEIPVTDDRWTAVNVNGTTFKKRQEVWIPERGRHGTLEERDGFFIYIAKDGTRYRYDYPIRPLNDPIRKASPPPPTPILDITDRNDNSIAFHYDDRQRLQRVVDAVNRELDFHYASIPGPGGPEDRLTRVAGPDGIELLFTYNDQGLLETARRADRVETYEYALQPDNEIAAYNLVKSIDSNGAAHEYLYCNRDEIDFNSMANVKVLRAEHMVKRVAYPDGAAAEIAYETTTENRRVVTDLRGNPTAYILNYFGNPRVIEEPEGKNIRMTWSIDEGKDDNVMTSKTDGRGFTSLYRYDDKGNISLETDPYENTISTTWDHA